LGTADGSVRTAGPTSQGVIMWSHTSRVAALALAVGALACSDRPPGTAPSGLEERRVFAPAGSPEVLARSLALALGDPAFRAHVKGELDRSPFREHGNRRLLDPEQPPSTPVIAVVPVETDFSAAPTVIGCLGCGDFFPWPPFPPPPPPVPGLYLTKAHFVDDFEGWLKGSPEFE